jgi:GNAT superfamily N-acetyltransferase
VDDAGAGRYPAELECRWTTRIGSILHVRPIRADDGPRLLAFHRQLSPTSVYRRHFFVHPELSVAETEYFSRVDYLDRLALIAEDSGRLIAVGRYDRFPGTTEAEVAFVVADAYQHLGIGTMLLDHLAAAARPVGITTFIASTLADNRAMVDVFLHSGFPVTTSSSHGVVSVRVSIGSRDPSGTCRPPGDDLSSCPSVDITPVPGNQGPSALPARPRRGQAGVTPKE